jgi:hypothetical protein
MILFLANTRLLLWVVAIIFILRWFHLFSSSSDDNNHETGASGAAGASAPAKQIPSGTASRLFTFDATHVLNSRRFPLNRHDGLK